MATLMPSIICQTVEQENPVPNATLAKATLPPPRAKKRLPRSTKGGERGRRPVNPGRRNRRRPIAFGLLPAGLLRVQGGARARASGLRREAHLFGGGSVPLSVLSDLRQRRVEAKEKRARGKRTRRAGCERRLWWDVGMAVWKGDGGHRKGE